MNITYTYLIVGIILVGIILICVFLLQPTTNIQINGTFNGAIKSNSCIVSSESVPNLSSVQCCRIFGRSTNLKFLSTLNMVVSPISTDYLTVCSGYCSAGFDNTNNKCADNPNVITEQQLFNQCVAFSKPDNCSDPSKPVAISGSTLLYPFSPGSQLCTDTGQCTVSI
jgi:hypothetical protein